ncbi:hypothetical protein OF83DRAFT_1173953 [Amylostereum chailletii]|nr:hypothetical protein OF83DRAFT_1173953 [Amylostereum chailletii]
MLAVHAPTNDAREDEPDTSSDEGVDWDDDKDERPLFVVKRGYETGPCSRETAYNRILGIGYGYQVKKKATPAAARESYRRAQRAGKVQAMGLMPVIQHDQLVELYGYHTTVYKDKAGPLSFAASHKATPILDALSQDLSTVDLRAAPATPKKTLASQPVTPFGSQGMVFSQWSQPTSLPKSSIQANSPTPFPQTSPASPASRSAKSFLIIANLEVVQGPSRLTTLPPTAWTPSASQGSSFTPENLPDDTPSGGAHRSPWYVLVKGLKPGIFKCWEDLLPHKKTGYCYGFDSYQDALHGYVELRRKNVLASIEV